jgi:prephenate dehydratase
MSTLELYSVVVSNKPGKGAKLLGALKDAGVNLTGIWGYPVGKKKARIDLVAEDPALLKKAAKQLKIDLGKKQIVFHISGEDHPGAIADLLAKLAAKDIDVYAVQTGQPPPPSRTAARGW